jgi:HAMP domain-containing protein
VAVPTFALVGGSLYLQRTIRADAQQKVDATLDLAINMEESLINERLQAMEHVAAAVANDRSVVASTALSDGKPDLTRFTQFYPTAKMLVVVNREGTVLGRASSAHAGDLLRLNGLVPKAMAEDTALAYPSLIEPAELKWESQQIRDQVSMVVRRTSRSTDPRVGTKLETALALVGVFPIHGPDGAVSGAVVAADIMNRDFSIVDEVARRSPPGVPLFATIALDGIRVTTNVKLTDPTDPGGIPTDQRALGTVYADEVVGALRQNREYRGRAPVVDQWQRTIYHPLRDFQGQVIAGPYVGIPEAYFTATDSTVTRSIGIVLSTVAVGLALAFALVLWWAWVNIIRPIRRFGEQAHAHSLQAAPQHESADEIGALSGALGELMSHTSESARAVEARAGQVDEAIGTLQEAIAGTVEDTARALAAANGTLQVSRELQVGAGQMAGRLKQLSDAIAAVTDGARRQGRSVQYTGKVAAEIAVALQDSRERVDRAIEGTGTLTDAARNCLKRVAEFTAGISILQQGLHEGQDGAMALLHDPSDLLVSVAVTSERVAEEVRLLALTIQENQARLMFIKEEMVRVTSVVEATADKTHQAGATAGTVTDWMERMVAGAQWMAADVETTHGSVEAMVAANGELQELATRVEDRVRELRALAENLK